MADGLSLDAAASPITAAGRTSYVKVAPGVTMGLIGWGASAAAAGAAGIGAVYLVSWLVGAGARWSAAGVLTMKANMAASLLMAGVSLWLVQPRTTTRTRRAVGVVLGIVVFLAGTLTLCEHVFGADFGIDQLLAIEAPGAVATASPNRFGPPGAVSLTLLGAALVALAWRRRVASYFALATAAIVLIPAVGYLAGVVQFYTELTTGIAWLTVIGLLLLCAGVHLAEGPDGPLGLVFRDDPGGKLLRLLLPGAMVAPVALQLLMRLGDRAGLYGHSTGVGILLVSLVVLIGGLLWRGAANVSSEAARAREAEERAVSVARLPQENPDPVLRLTRDYEVAYANDGARSALATLGVAVGAPAPRAVVELAERALSEGNRVHGEVSAGDRFYSMSVVAVGDDVNVYAHDMTELRDANRAKDDFLGMLSHELRNPLAPIRNSLYILDHAEPTGQVARRAKEVANRQLTHLTRLVDDLLDVTRIVRGKVELRRTDLDITELTRRIADDHRTLMTERGLQFDIEAPDTPVWVNGDETRLAQVIGNLLQNAAKFTPQGGRVTVSVTRHPDAAEVRVRDTGAGVEPELLPDIFNPFVQAKQSLARTQGGLGLGLALVKALVEMHDGTVTVESAGRGRGATFTVTLPVVATATATADAPGRLDARPTNQLRVLVVDDNKDAADSLADLVRVLGHYVEVAFDGESAVRLVNTNPFDIVLCDIGLPGMTGYQVAEALRRDERFDSVQLIAVSGYAMPEDRQRALDAGFADHIAKPADPAKVLRLLQGGKQSPTT